MGVGFGGLGRLAPGRALGGLAATPAGADPVQCDRHRLRPQRGSSSSSCSNTSPGCPARPGSGCATWRWPGTAAGPRWPGGSSAGSCRPRRAGQRAVAPTDPAGSGPAPRPAAVLAQAPAGTADDRSLRLPQRHLHAAPQAQIHPVRCAPPATPFDQQSRAYRRIRPGNPSVDVTQRARKPRACAAGLASGSLPAYFNCQGGGAAASHLARRLPVRDRRPRRRRALRAMGRARGRRSPQC